MNDPYEVLSVADAEVPSRVSYLRQVGVLTFGSLLISATAAVASMMAIASLPILQNQIAMFVIVLGGIYGAQFIGGSMVVSPSSGTRSMGFMIGSVLQGLALGYILLFASSFAMAEYGNPFIFIGQAGALVGLTVLGMVAYLLTGPRQVSVVASAMSMLSLPMLGLMAISWIFPIGGTLGIIISAAFVLFSAGALYYSLNRVMHHMTTDMVMAGAFEISTSIVVLFYNVLNLLLSLASRD
ncbi:MAG: Bax inhibitor-1 family protein [Myxococcales bacterium]|nr:Bax inhibitor-1 family protein [Myxococcales bacterium]